MAKKTASKTVIAADTASDNKIVKQHAAFNVADKKIPSIKAVAQKSAIEKKPAKKTSATTNAASTTQVTGFLLSDEECRLIISMRAYYRWQDAQCAGDHINHWLGAEQEVHAMLHR